MERTINRKPIDGKRIHALASELVNRAVLSSRLGLQHYSGNRDLYQALGYMSAITFADYYARYRRQDIAKAIIDRPVKATWQGSLELVESNEPKDTAFEIAWDKLNRDLGLKTRFSRLDRLTGIGKYGVLLLGFNDTKKIDDFQKEVSVGRKELKYVRPFGEDSAQIEKYEENPVNPRYGLPLEYKITVGDPNSKSTRLVVVHYSRVIHITDSPLESEVFGTPRLEAVFNRLMDVEKLVGGDAEMFWRGARPGYHGKLQPDYQLTEATKEDLQDQIDEYENNLRRILINEGIDLDALEQQIADPATHFQVQLQCISAETGIPLRILTGSERGELASSEDRSEWLSYVQTRREEHAEPCIVRPFVDYMIKVGVLPTPEKDYSVKWADLFAQSEKARVEIGKARANAIREYTSNPMAMEVIPPSMFMETCLGYTSEQIELAHAIREDEMEEEIEKMKKVKDILGGGDMSGEPKDEEKTNEQRGEPEKKREMPSGSV